KAATQAGTANTQYMAAKEQNDAIQTAQQIAEEQQRVTAVDAAKRAADSAVTAAETAKDNAAQAATAAETARDEAEAAYMMAMASRTDSATAKAEYEKAKAAAMMARTAATDANTAYMAAKMAAEGIMDDGTAEAAREAQSTAEEEQEKAEMAEMTAETEQGKAETAETEAMTAADTHVLSLFQAANGAHVMDDANTPADEKAAHVTRVGAAMATIASATDGNQAASTVASALWSGDTVDDPTTDADEFVEGTFSFTVNIAGNTAITSELKASRAATDLNGDGDTDDTGEARIIQTARMIEDLGVFRGYDLWEDDGDADTTTDRARAIVFTNKQQGDDSVLAVVGGAARSVKGQDVAVGELSNVRSSGDTITGVTWTPSGEAPLMGTLTCGETCNIVLGENGAVTTITGYTFTGSRATVEEVEAADAGQDDDYLIFGLWLDEDTTTTPNTNTFGAFASGGTAAPVGDVITGTATYTGKAAGAHHMTGEGVNWFDGDARLTANFGPATGDGAAGTVSGAISNIRVAGGEAMSTPIYLGEADLTTDTATFNGAAFMGAATAPGADTHEFDGTWSGSFFGPSAAVVDDPETTEDETLAAGALAPAATAGTFGVTKSTGTGDDEVVESFVGAFGAHKE
ncbi:MAG: hypothetical protein OXE53_16305, partial [Deltaproteobacteria bacterium]|nr:hypothetical protein [Deltaproteobacteria bacterium]